MWTHENGQTLLILGTSTFTNGFLHTFLFSVIDRTLFQDEDTDTDISGMSAREKQKYFQEIERIRSELAGFQPIDTPRTESLDPGSPEMAEITQDLC